MSDDRFEGFLRESARDYHAPPTTPREEMWAVIDRHRTPRRGAVRPHVRRPLRVATRWAWRVAALAAVLVLGIGIGLRLRGPATSPSQSTSVLAEDTAQEESTVYRVAAVDYLERTDAFLAAFRTDASLVGIDEEVANWAGDLLLTARLLMDSPAGDDPELRRLLEDLELVLAQISQVAASPGNDELNLIEQGLEEQGLLMRLRAALNGADEDLAQGAI